MVLPRWQSFERWDCVCLLFSYSVTPVLRHWGCLHMYPYATASQSLRLSFSFFGLRNDCGTSRRRHTYIEFHFRSGRRRDRSAALFLNLYPQCADVQITVLFSLSAYVRRFTFVPSRTSSRHASLFLFLAALCCDRYNAPVVAASTLSASPTILPFSHSCCYCTPHSIPRVPFCFYELRY